MKNYNETGRLMAGVLGALVVIGIFSVGGIVAYKSAENREQANEALEIANKYAAVCFEAKKAWQAAGNTGDFVRNHVPHIKDTGLVEQTITEPDNNGQIIIQGVTNSGAIIKKLWNEEQITDDSVTVRIDFYPNESVCKAAAELLDRTADACHVPQTNKEKKAAGLKTEIEVVFKQN